MSAWYGTSGFAVSSSLRNPPTIRARGSSRSRRFRCWFAPKAIRSRSPRTSGSAVHAANTATTFNRATSLERILAEQLVQRRVTTDVIGGFATAALALAALGMYRTARRARRQPPARDRRPPRGRRLADSVARQVVGESLRNTVAGLAIGCLLALVTGSLIQSLLVGVSARDPLTLGTVASVLLVVAVAAALIPAWRAARTDPVEALRSPG